MVVTHIVLWVFISYIYTFTKICSAKECSEDYILEDFTAKSTTATVLRGKRKSNPDETIAIKRPITESEDDIRSELEIMSYIDQVTRCDGEESGDRNNAALAENSNLVKLLGECTINGILSITMEYLPDILDNVISPTHLTLRDYKPEFLTYAFLLIQAVETLQRNEIVHGDLTPANVGLNTEGVLKVFDFSHSYLVQNPYLGMTCAPLYAAPESLLFDDISDRLRSDTWSAGVIIYEMFSAELYIGPWMMEYEECERESSGATWQMYETCSGRALYYAHRLNRCSKDDIECASIYRDIEERLEKECKPNALCLATIDKRYREQEEFNQKMESLMLDEQKRITIGEATKEDLIDLLVGLLRFDFTQRLQPKSALSHNIFRQFTKLPESNILNY